MTTKKIGSVLAIISLILITMICVIFMRLGGSVGNIALTAQPSRTLPDGNYEMVVTDKLSKPITLSMSPRQYIAAGLKNSNLWYYVVIDGGKKAGGDEYPVPPWKDIQRLGWKAPEVICTRIQHRLIPEKNRGVHADKLVFTISTVQ